VFGALLLGDRATRRQTLGIGVAVLGTLVLAGSDWRVSGRALVGDGLALLGAITAAGYLVVGRHLRASMTLIPYLAIVNTVAAIVLLLAAGIADVPLRGFSWSIYGWIAACAILPSLIGHTLLNWSVRRTPAHLVTLGILGEPVGATLLSGWIVAEQPPAIAAVGGAIILVGIGVGFSRPSARAAAVVAPAPPD
jgi:drug/metabolite transporter (DMT)-like permease